MKSRNIESLVYMSRESEFLRKWGNGAKKITPLQRTWTRYMLDIWGCKYGGKVTIDGLNTNVIGRLMMRREWNDREAERIITVVENLAKQGYTGDELFIRAKEIIMPNNSVASVINQAKESDDADFVERVMLSTLSIDHPSRLVAIAYFCNRKCIQDIAREIAKKTMSDIQLSRKRVVWCESLLEKVMYHAMRADLEKNNLLN